MSTSPSSSSLPTNSSIFYYFNQYFIDNEDSRAKDYPFVNILPWKLLSFMGIYLLLTTYIIPKIMKNSQPFNLRGPILIYNIVMVIINCCFFPYFFYTIYYERILLDFEYPP